MAAKQGARSIGVQVAILLYFVCRVKKLFNSSRNVVFKLVDFRYVDVSGATVVYVFGMSDSLKPMLKEKLECELAPGSRVVSYALSLL